MVLHLLALLATIPVMCWGKKGSKRWVEYLLRARYMRKSMVRGSDQLMGGHRMVCLVMLGCRKGLFLFRSGYAEAGKRVSVVECRLLSRRNPFGVKVIREG